MKCVICHGEQIELKKVNEEIKLNNDIVYVPISVNVCRTCGEHYYDRNTMQFLEETEKKLNLNTIRLKEIGKVMTIAV